MDVHQGDPLMCPLMCIMMRLAYLPATIRGAALLCLHARLAVCATNAQSAGAIILINTIPWYVIRYAYKNACLINQFPKHYYELSALLMAF